MTQASVAPRNAEETQANNESQERSTHIATFFYWAC